MPAEGGVIATFVEPSTAAAAMLSLRERGFKVRALMPAAYPDVIAAVGKPRSRLDLVTLPGALLGVGLGILLTAGTSLAWPLVTGGKPIVSWPPFLIVTFEVAVLVGSLVNLVAVAVGTWRGGRRSAFPAAGPFPSDRIAVHAAGDELAVAERLLRSAGAVEVSRVA
ncbi:MAG TPA: quinol:electron acceptor oxidoreductase subunit ActD [Anaeromyxobacteraceae bacterium]|nr:quinol:electron acceptor oxidoreductase subunit ActD [Anaeromyxobacteraceae bacterium]